MYLYTHVHLCLRLSPTSNCQQRSKFEPLALAADGVVHRRRPFLVTGNAPLDLAPKPKTVNFRKPKTHPQPPKPVSYHPSPCS